MKNMKALVLKRYGGLDQVAFADLPRPALQPDEILVQVHAAGLNPIDYMIPKGTFKPMLKFQLPATLGSDLAGIVMEVGNRVTRFKPVDTVFASIFDLGTDALAEFAVVPEKAAAFLFAHPDGWQLTEIGELLKAGRIRPLIDKVFPFDQAKDALAYLEKGRAKGKVVVQIR